MVLLSSLPLNVCFCTANVGNEFRCHRCIDTMRVGWDRPSERFHAAWRIFASTHRESNRNTDTCLRGRCSNQVQMYTRYVSLMAHSHHAAPVLFSCTGSFTLPVRAQTTKGPATGVDGRQGGREGARRRRIQAQVRRVALLTSLSLSLSCRWRWSLKTVLLWRAWCNRRVRC